VEILPFLTQDKPGTGGRIKVLPEDFLVEEIPLYEPGGQGQHIYVLLEKRGLSTREAIGAIARGLDVPTRDIGYAGMKDARAVTRQMISINNIEPERVEALDLSPEINILSVSSHRNKLKLGHLAGNRFTIRVRDVTREALPIAEAVLAELDRRGVPNYFGAQRFGMRENTHILGWALLRGDADGFAHEYLGHPRPGDPPLVRAAREAFDTGDYRAALAGWPSSLRDERRALAAMVRHGDDARRAPQALDKKLRRLFVSAYQSHLFNQLLADRIRSLDRLEAGDVAYIHASGAAFIVQDPLVEQPRADRLEISPSGPLFGPKTLLAEEVPGEKERELLAETGLSLDEFRLPGVKFKGARRPFRLPLSEVQVGWDDGLLICFRLPPGGYATEVLREVMKDQRGDVTRGVSIEGG
jgi:tRNA pseudouridine13 synthase